MKFTDAQNVILQFIGFALLVAFIALLSITQIFYGPQNEEERKYSQKIEKIQRANPYASVYERHERQRAAQEDEAILPALELINMSKN